MRRWLFNVAAGLSLLLLIAVCALWARSYGRADEFTFTSRWSGFIAIDSYEGRVYAGLYHNPNWRRPYVSTFGAETDLRPFWQSYLQFNMQQRGHTVGGFGFLRHDELRPGAIRPIMRVAMAPQLVPRRAHRRAAGPEARGHIASPPPRPLPPLRVRPDRQRQRHLPRVRHAGRRRIPEYRRL